MRMMRFFARKREQRQAQHEFVVGKTMLSGEPMTVPAIAEKSGVKYYRVLIIVSSWLAKGWARNEWSAKDQGWVYWLTNAGGEEIWTQAIARIYDIPVEFLDKPKP